MTSQHILQLSFVTLLCIVFNLNTTAQTITGATKNAKNGEPVPFVNIGVVSKGIGTVSDENGQFKITLDQAADSDTILVSCVGFGSLNMRVGDFKKMTSHQLKMEEKVYQMPELVVKATDFVQKILGVKTKNRSVSAGFSDNKLGYELGILMKVKKSAIPERLDINFAECAFDSIFYRVNIYSYSNKRTFENILSKPIYLKMAKSELKETVSIDLKPYNLRIEGDFLVTLEHIKDLGKGKLMFCSKLGTRSYIRNTSQDKWQTVPVGVSISIDARIEK